MRTYCISIPHSLFSFVKLNMVYCHLGQNLCYLVTSAPHSELSFFKAVKYLVSNADMFSHLTGVSRLMDLLADSREVIRNDVSVIALH